MRSTSRTARHDDLVFAVGLAAWIAETRVEPYTGPLCYNGWAKWPVDEAEQEGRVKSWFQDVLDDLGIDPDGDW